jgi:hypothetical protein
VLYTVFLDVPSYETTLKSAINPLVIKLETAYKVSTDCEKQKIPSDRKDFSDERLNNHEDRCMKLCSNCGQPIQEDSNKNPAELLGDLVERLNSEDEDHCLCQTCKEELGMLSLIGFSE